MPETALQSMPEPHKRATRPIDPSKPLQNTRHERMVQELLKGATVVDAHERAGFARNTGNAATTNGLQSVQKRLAYLQSQATNKIVKETAVIDKRYVLQQAHRMFEASANAAIPAGEDGAFDHQAAGVAARFLDQIGRHRDVQAFKDDRDTNITITVDAAISRLAHGPVDVIEGDYEDVTSEDGSL